jgi:(E)-4-hydroxy-3-methylbut-2-enyl-diphosphate synthase
VAAAAPRPAGSGSPFAPRRRATREVRVGEVGIGGANPLRVQSMLTTDSLDTRASVEQIERLVAAGCEIVRLTVPSLREAENLPAIRAELGQRGLRVPLVADIHFTPAAALLAAEHVEKVRINPGNYADKKRFAVREYSDSEYAAEIERVAERFRPLVRRCRELGRALRIGTNHGSLSDRIMNRYGDSPRGMVESALEFLDVCEDEGFHDVVFSMKASNPLVAISAYRLLAARLGERAPGCPSYPFHVGVTEAGDGEDGRVKSAIGIGTLLVDGLGDTIRVSLTEDPVKEVPVARALARLAEAMLARAAEVADPGAPFVADPLVHARRATRPVGRSSLEQRHGKAAGEASPGPAAQRAAGERSATEIGGESPIRVELDLGPVPADPASAARELARAFARARGLACEGLLVECLDPEAGARLELFAKALAAAGIELPLAVRVEAGWAEGAAAAAGRIVAMAGALVPDEELAAAAACAARRRVPLEWELRAAVDGVAGLVDRCLAASAAAGAAELLFSVDADLPVLAVRAAAARLRARGAGDAPIVLRHRRAAGATAEEACLRAAVELGAPLADGIGDAVALAGFADAAAALDLGYRVLQGARQRTTRTEFISCPSCGRTLFDLEEVTARIKARTQHLPGVKIAVMGCIVNGPGEMADADFGYVGSGPGVVNLYVGKQCVERKVPEAEAPDRLVELIRSHGRWVDPT